MEITLEKIELVKDRTGVSYKEAKDALEECDGSVVDAIISIEETVDQNKGAKVNEFAQDTIDKVKELVKKGNVSKISVKKDGEILVNIPVNVGIVGAVVAPWGLLAAAIASYGFKCKIEVITNDGNVINVSEKVDNVYDTVKEKSAVIVDEVKDKAPEVFNGVVEKGQDLFEQAKEKAPEVWQTVKENTPDTWEDVKGMAQEKFNEFKNRTKDGDLLEDLEVEMSAGEIDEILAEDEEDK